MCDCKKDANLFLASGVLFWGWHCKCVGKWTTQTAKVLSLKDIKPESIPKAPAGA